MTKINQTAANASNFTPDKNNEFDIVKFLNNNSDGIENFAPVTGDRNAPHVKAGYDKTGYIRQDLSNKQNLGVGGPQQVSANSSPEELLKNPRVRAMLDTIAYAEGTGNNYGRVVYGTVVGPKDPNAPYDRSLIGKKNVVVSDFRHHPNLLVRWANGQPLSSAAGRYQFLSSTWKGLGMKDFTPHSQDLAAIKLMKQRGMIEPLLRGDFATAVNKGSAEWASLPKADGNGTYPGQNARKLEDLRNVFNTSLKRYQGSQPTPPSTPNPPATGGSLTRGERGQAVSNLQDKLIRFGLMTASQKKTGPGIFGPRTEAAVKDFQKGVGQAQTGRFDAAANTAMNKLLSGNIKRGASGPIVRELQQNLVKLGYMTQSQVRTGPGTFGPRTDAALKRFQADHGLVRDGIFGPKSFGKMHAALERRTNAPTPTQPKPPKPEPPVSGNAPEYRRWNVYSTGHSPARLADGYEDLQPHHDYQSVNYVSRQVKLDHRLEARDIVLTRPGQSNFGQAVPSPLEGKVLYAGNEGDGYGNKVIVKNEKTGQIMLVGHLQSINVKKGQTVRYGQNLGGQGSTGNSTGAHIHINADPSVIKRWTADLADGKFDGVRQRFDVGRRP